MLLFYYVAAVILAEAAEYSRMACGGAFLRQEAAVMVELVKYNIFLGAEEGIEGLARDLSFPANVAYAYLVKRIFFEKPEHGVGYKLL